MAEAQYAHNHTIDPETGYLESKAYPYAFHATKKERFIKCLVENGLGIYETCEAMGISHNTFNKHYRNDPAFKKDFDEARKEYGSRLDALSKRNAMKDRSVIERIFQLKSIFPEKYADQRSSNANLNISISIDNKLLEKVTEREKMIDAELLSEDKIEHKK